MSEPTQTCAVCGDVEICRPSARGFPPETAKRKLVKRCAARGHVSAPQYRAGVLSGSF